MFENTKRIKDLILDVSNLSSVDELWEAFTEGVSEGGFNRWRYITHRRVTQDSDMSQFAGLKIAASQGEDLTDIAACRELPQERFVRFARILRHIESPCYFEDIPQRLIVSQDSLSEIRQRFVINIDETVLIIPCFGATLSSGYFLFVTQKSRRDKKTEDLTLLSMQSQLAHNCYQTLTMDMREPKITLSNREKKILEYIAEGYSNFEVGKALGLSPHVINVYVKVIFKKTKSDNRTAAALNGLALGLIK